MEDKQGRKERTGIAKVRGAEGLCPSSSCITLFFFFSTQCANYTIANLWLFLFILGLNLIVNCFFFFFNN